MSGMSIDAVLTRYAQLHAETKAMRKHSRTLAQERRRLDGMIKSYMDTNNKEELMVPNNTVSIRAREKTAKRHASGPELVRSLSEQVGIDPSVLTEAVRSLTTETKRVKLCIGKSGPKRRGRPSRPVQRPAPPVVVHDSPPISHMTINSDDSDPHDDVSYSGVEIKEEEMVA